MDVRKMEGGVKTYCGVKREKVNDNYVKALEALNNWYWEATGDAYTVACVKEFRVRNKVNKDEEIDRIQKEYEEELDRIYNEYLARESEIYTRFVKEARSQQK